MNIVYLVCVRNGSTTLLLPVVRLFASFLLHENKVAAAAMYSHVLLLHRLESEAIVALL